MKVICVALRQLGCGSTVAWSTTEQIVAVELAQAPRPLAMLDAFLGIA